MSKQIKKLILRGKAAVFIDWANVYGWKKSLKREVDSKQLHRFLGENYESFIFFTGDGDYEPLYKLLVNLGKQVIVVYTQGHLRREIWNIKRGIFKVELKNLGEFWT